MSTANRSASKSSAATPARAHSRTPCSTSSRATPRRCSARAARPAGDLQPALSARTIFQHSTPRDQQSAGAAFTSYAEPGAPRAGVTLNGCGSSAPTADRRIPMGPERQRQIRDPHRLEPRTATSFPTAGTENIGLRVIDSNGASASVTQLDGGRPAAGGQAESLAEPGARGTDGDAERQRIDRPGHDHRLQVGSERQRQVRNRHRHDADGHHQLQTPGTHTVGVGVTDTRPQHATTISVTVLEQAARRLLRSGARAPRADRLLQARRSQGPTILDSQGLSTGTIAAARSACRARSRTSTAVGFNGSSDSGAIPLNLSGTSQLTIEFWLKWNQYANNDALAMEFTPNFNENAGGFLVDPNAGEYGGTFGSGSATPPTATASSSPAQRRRVAPLRDRDRHDRGGRAERSRPTSTASPSATSRKAPKRDRGRSRTRPCTYSRATAIRCSGRASWTNWRSTTSRWAPTTISSTTTPATSTPRRRPRSRSTLPAVTRQSVTFNASGSTDSQGTITDYRWDLNGSGKYETDTGTQPDAHPCLERARHLRGRPGDDRQQRSDRQDHAHADRHPGAAVQTGVDTLRGRAARQRSPAAPSTPIHRAGTRAVSPSAPALSTRSRAIKNIVFPSLSGYSGGGGTLTADTLPEQLRMVGRRCERSRRAVGHRDQQRRPQLELELRSRARHNRAERRCAERQRHGGRLHATSSYNTTGSFAIARTDYAEAQTSSQAGLRSSTLTSPRPPFRQRLRHLRASHDDRR